MGQSYSSASEEEGRKFRHSLRLDRMTVEETSAYLSIEPGREEGRTGGEVRWGVTVHQFTQYRIREDHGE